ncbi:MAG: aldehyde ferredoxin oxidoreductase N-terminal domain-containing protein [Clostridia bacterium]|nr:aldehyde ferredoxin oxidoreductase N-terminal domain-containing protein [Clostridia bacterium]
MANGWTGKLLRLNLTTKTATVEDNKYNEEWLGGMGLGYAIMHDEVPVGTDPAAPEMKMVMAAGPLTGAGAPCSGRTNITLYSPVTEKPLVVDAHMGGHFGPQIKYCGYDAIIIEGAADSLTWVKINDDKVEFNDASEFAGMGTREMNKVLGQQVGSEYTLCLNGIAGENKVRMSVLLNDVNHAAGVGTGYVWGCKNLKAIAIYGTGAVHVADPMKALNLYKYQLTELIGANNNHVVPSTQQSWNEYVSWTRWQGGEGKEWEQGIGGPVPTGEQNPADPTAVGKRTNVGNYFFGKDTDLLYKKNVKNGGCAHCPIRCVNQVHIEELGDYGLEKDVSAVCFATSHTNGFYPAGTHSFTTEGDQSLVLGYHIAQVMDDYGLWCGYGEMDNYFSFCWKNGIFEKVLPAEEYAEIPWDLMKDGDPRWADEMIKRISTKQGEFATLGEGAWRVVTKWGLPENFYDQSMKFILPKLGVGLHHSSESMGQVGALINILFNRDPMCHTHQNCIGNGLPNEVIQSVLDGMFGEGAFTAQGNYTPMTQARAKWAKWAIVRNNVHDMATLCNWVWPMIFSPLKERGYKGDTSLEAQLISATTGVEYTEEQVDFIAEKVLQLHRAMTALEMGSANLRQDHDPLSAWVFDRDPDKEAFTPGTSKLDRADFEVALDMFYTEFGWDVATGIPTRATLEKFGLGNVADELAAAGLLPA